MHFQKTISNMDHFCDLADSLVEHGRNSDMVFVKILREYTKETFGKSFEKIELDMKKKNIKNGIDVIIDSIGIWFNEDDSLNKFNAGQNRLTQNQKNQRQFKERWESGIRIIFEADIDKLFKVLRIHQEFGYYAAISYLLPDIHILNPRRLT